MRKLATLAAIAAIATTVPPAVVIGQGSTQTISAVDVKVLTTGLRSSRIVGSEVYNENRQSVGRIDDLIISRDEHGVFAVISVGGFLGIGSKLVAVRYEDLQATPDNKGFVLPGASKDKLQTLPEFKYSD
jgi:PRC-barrel domain